ncbi:alkaline phosphatase [Arthrobacter sp. MYb211]|uniref:DeoR/GlpR family DNA-binding transcription regulator n=1 Tax=Micrococcaceae TaxID=1268 RepID=UPI000CFB22DB|nr:MULTISPECIES: DeoR/GlpR family DNA-binding transcription regulator [unclassified Arthrobacter]PRA02417.1 alkaline phosphatase [Arthrobacter sp. MYb229]PRA13394.1 alkaline phosphatase [Arthrobacter sp. MYb221]PRB50640.1 alkaline phosphatase [Arthrobacter sp. MYb216]PRC10591.1 alkaline phosphatase [Arthrobacter sp. MYb211]
MKREERLNHILDLLASNGQIDVEQIVQQLEISPATARRDLDSLSNASLLTRTHGGAVSNTVAYDLPSRYQREDHDERKLQIARLAAGMVEADTVVGLSGGTTTKAIAIELGMRQDLVGEPGRITLTVVTNAVNIASLLAVRPHIRVMVTGGVLNERSYELVGPLAQNSLGKITLDMAFVGINALEPSIGAMVSDEMEAAVNELMINQSRRSYLVADASKIGGHSFVILDRENLTGLITDDQITDEQREALAMAGIPVITKTGMSAAQ